MTSHLDGTEYPKINGVFKRHTEGPDKGRFIMGDFAKPEFETLLHVPWYWSEKIDGTNIRLVYVPPTDEDPAPRVLIGGRTAAAQLHRDLVAAIENLIDPKVWGEVFGFRKATVYGEGYGAGIQKVGSLYRPDKSFIGFDVRLNGVWLDTEGAKDIMHRLGLYTVRGPWEDTLDRAIKVFQIGQHGGWFPSEFHPDAFEGIIGRPAGGLLDRFGQRIQTKLKVVDFRP